MIAPTAVWTRRLSIRSIAAVVVVVLCQPATSHAESSVASEATLTTLLAADRLDREVADDLKGKGWADVILTFAIPVGRTASGLRDYSTPAARDAIRSVGDSILSQFRPGEFELHRRYVIVNALAGRLRPDGLARLAARPDLLRVEVDAPTHTNLTESLPLTSVDDVKAAGWTGNNVHVAVIDSGIDTDHPDLSDDLVAEQCFCSGCCPGGGSTGSGPGSAEDGFYHGTLVSGIITGKGTMAPEGAAPDAEIVAVKTQNSSGSGQVSDLIAGFDWVAAQRMDVEVVTTSIGFGSFAGNCDTNAIATPIETLRARGVLTFVATGNRSSSTTVDGPACVTAAMAVSATYDYNGTFQAGSCNNNDLLSVHVDDILCYANNNALTDLFAPGAFITATGLGGGSRTDAGTSFAAPIAAGCAADLREKNPSLTADQLETALETSPKIITDSRNGLMRPRLDCQAALGAIASIPTPPPTIPPTIPPSPTRTRTVTPTPTVTPTRTVTPTPLVCGCPDSDGDGKPDFWDQCPNTTHGVITDETGCVEACGCPDSDGDGVVDAWDLCPNTQAGRLTDANGCPGSTSPVDPVRSPVSLVVACILFLASSTLRRPRGARWRDRSRR